MTVVRSPWSVVRSKDRLFFATDYGPRTTDSSHFLLQQHFPQPLAILIIQRHGGVALIVDLVREVALVVAAREGRVQVEHRVTVIAGQRQTEARQALRQGRGVNLVALRLRGAR